MVLPSLDVISLAADLLFREHRQGATTFVADKVRESMTAGRMREWEDWVQIFSSLERITDSTRADGSTLH